MAAVAACRDRVDSGHARCTRRRPASSVGWPGQMWCPLLRRCVCAPQLLSLRHGTAYEHIHSPLYSFESSGLGSTLAYGATQGLHAARCPLQMLRAKSRSIVDTALSVLETTLVWCRAADASDVGLARTGLFELLLLVRRCRWPG